MIRKIDLEKDHETLCKWWEGHGWPKIEKENFPELGFMANEKAAVFLYQTDSKIAWMEWLVSDPNSDQTERHQALDEVILHTTFEAYRLGYRTLFTFTNHHRVKERLLKNNFHIGDEHTSTYVRRLESCQ